MGLDMYLYARRHVSGYEFVGEEEKRLYTGLVDLFGVKEFVDPDTPSGEVQVCVAYWRKANAIHKWFVDNVQDGVDECQFADVEREQLEALRRDCMTVLNGLNVEDGTVIEGYAFHEDSDAPLGLRAEPIEAEGKVVADPALAQEILPTQAGFFFGSTDYDEGYVADLIETANQIDRVLKMTDERSVLGFSLWSFVYHSSW